MKPGTAKVKGVQTENLWIGFLKEYGIANAERRRLQGALDKGDVAGWCAHDGSWNVVSEVKSGAVLKIPEWLEELEAEVANAKAETGHIVVRPKGKPNPYDWFIIMPAPPFMELMRKAGYLD